jgi:16S rRNA (uracil1498-N3)-methyltransferase
VYSTCQFSYVAHTELEFHNKSWTSAKDIFIIVGPEGGLSRDEIAQAREAGFISVSLGRQILKVETAAMAIISIIQYEKGIFSQTTGR